jgi:hypothetical protein
MDSLGPLQAELQALSRERDPELRAESLLSLAGRQERRDRPELAAQIYGELLQSPELSPSLRRRAQTRFDALGGAGEIGARAEVLASRFIHEVSDPNMLFAMTVAGGAFRATRLFTLARLASSPAGFLTRGIGARGLAGLAGFGVEATVFPAAGRLGNLALGRELEWSASTLSQEWASSFLMLGALKAGGLLTGSLASRSNFWRPFLRQGGMFGGIVLGHQMEVAAGLRERSSPAMTVLDSLATLAQFNVAGRLNRSLLGEGMRTWEQRVDAQTRALSQMPWRLPTLTIPGTSPAFATATPTAQLGSGLLLSERLPELLNIAAPSASSGVAPRPAISELRSLRDGRSRPVDRSISPNIRVIEGQGVFWLIDGDTQDRSRNFEVRVGDELLRPGGSLRLRPGDIIRLGARSFLFQGAEVPDLSEVVARRSLHIGLAGGKDGFRLFLPASAEAFPASGSRRIAEGPSGEVFVETETARDGRQGFRVHDGQSEIRSSIAIRGRRWVLENFTSASPLLSTIFLDWLMTQAYIHAAAIEVPNPTIQIQRSLEHGMIQDSYTRQHEGPDGSRLVVRPRSTLLPPEMGEQHRAAADQAFSEWSERRLGFRVPTLSEIEAGQDIAPIDRLGVEANMEAILGRLVGKDTRFLEVGYGGRLETLQAVERLGGRARGLELNATYPAGSDPAELRRSEHDVLFLNGSPFLFFAGHQVSLPGAFDLLRPSLRAQTLLVQAYNPRTPFEILRHLEELHGLIFEPLYYRPATSISEAPLFPTDWCQRPDTRHAVLVARRR